MVPLYPDLRTTASTFQVVVRVPSLHIRDWQHILHHTSTWHDDTFWEKCKPGEEYMTTGLHLHKLAVGWFPDLAKGLTRFRPSGMSAK